MKNHAFALCTLAALLSACASEDEAALWTRADDELASPETAEEALSLGGDLGFSCSTTSCSCTPTSPDSSADTCRGALDACHERGWTLVCVWNPNGTASCTCDAGTGARLVTRAGVVSSGGAVVRAR